MDEEARRDLERCNLTRVERRAVEAYWKRRASAPERIDNSALPAGSPMIYFCHHCGIHTETLPETHLERPKTCCDGCRYLVNHMLMPPPKLE